MDVYLKAPGDGHVIGFTLPVHPVIERQWTDGTLSRVNADGTPYEEGPPELPAEESFAVGGIIGDGDLVPVLLNPGEAVLSAQQIAELATAEPIRPADTALKPEWIAYAVALGVYGEAEAKKLNKADLVAACTPPEMLPADPGE